MPDTPQDEGRAWERETQARIGGELVPQSGAGVRKLDVGGSLLIVSNKWTSHGSLRIDEAMLAELAEATLGAGGYGAHVTGVIAARIAGLGRDVAILDWEDYLRQLEDDVKIIPPSKDTARRAQAATPSFFRED